MKVLNKEELHRRVGHPSQLYSVRRVTLREGSGVNIDLFEVETACGLRLDILPDTGLDIGNLKYKGKNISYISKNGYDSPARFSSHEREFLQTFPAGMLYTCGLRSIGAPVRDGDEWHPQHGRYHGYPAMNPAAYVDGDDIIIRGIIRETALFGHCLQLERIIRIPIFGSEIQITDTVENLTPAESELLVLYHFNFGYPMLSENAKLIIPDNRKTTPNTEFSKTGLGRECVFDAPTDQEQERVFLHELPKPIAKLENPTLGIGAELSWSGETLPILTQWRCMASGEYVLGLEPTSTFTTRQKAVEENQPLPTLRGFEKRVFKTSLKFYDI